MTTKLERLLDPNSIVVFDGAMGTMLYSKGVFINQCYDELNVRAPDMVRDIHKKYVDAYTKKFNDHAKAHPDTVMLMISADLPFAQGRFCTAEGTASGSALPSAS